MGLYGEHNQIAEQLVATGKEEARPLLPGETKDTSDDGLLTPPTLSVTYKVIRLLVTSLMHFMIGVFNEAAGPIIPELIVQTNSSYEQIMTALSMRGGGHAIGGILGGFLVDHLFRYIDMFGLVCTVSYTVVSVMAVYMTDIVVMSAACFLQGVLVTIINILCLRVVLTTYKEHSATPCLVRQLGYFLGGVVGPVMVEPYLDSRLSGIHFTQGGTHNMTVIIGSHNSTAGGIPYDYPGKFVFAYWLIAAIAMLVSLSQLGLHTHGRVTRINLIAYAHSDNTAMTLKEKLSFRTCSPSHPVLAGLLILCQCFFYGATLTLARTFSKVIFSYDRDGPGLSVLASSWMTSSFFVSSVVGIITILPPTSYLHIKYILQTQTTMLLTVCILMYFLHRNVTALWILFISLGFLSGPLVSSGFAMMNRYIEVTATSQIIPHIGLAICDVIGMIAVGYSYDNYGPSSIWTILVIVGAIIFTASVCMQIFAHLHGDRFTKNSLA